MNIQHPDIVVHHIKTKNKIRKITAYRSDDCELRVTHQKFHNFMEELFIPSIFTKGYVKKTSIYHNALAHMYNDYFLMFDIKNFFPNICHKQLADKMYRELNLIEPNQVSKKECIDIINMCSTNTRGLPLGFITSPILSNIYLKDFDNIFYGKLKKMNLTNVIYTRYADDIVVSFQNDGIDKLLTTETLINQQLSKILERYGLHLNERKTRSYNLNISNHVRITGINITKSDTGIRKLTIGRSVKNTLYWDALRCYEHKEQLLIDHVKGLQSFILSVEKNGYENCYSDAMIKKITDLGFTSLKDLINSL